MSEFKAGVDGVTFTSGGQRLLGEFYRAAGDIPRPTAVLVHGTPGIEKHLDVAYQLRDLGWNCLCFHFRGSWGSQGAFSFGGLAEDTSAAMKWVRQQPSVDLSRVALIGASTGFYATLLHAVRDPALCAIVGISPLVDPRKFEFARPMAEHFAAMLSGVKADELVAQWNALPELTDDASLAARPMLLVTADKDEIFPPSHYIDFISRFPSAEWARAKDSDHSFSTCRPWLVDTVTDWLNEHFGG